MNNGLPKDFIDVKPSLILSKSLDRPITKYTHFKRIANLRTKIVNSYFLNTH